MFITHLAENNVQWLSIRRLIGRLGRLMRSAHDGAGRSKTEPDHWQRGKSNTEINCVLQLYQGVNATTTSTATRTAKKQWV